MLCTHFNEEIKFCCYRFCWKLHCSTSCCSAVTRACSGSRAEDGKLKPCEVGSLFSSFCLHVGYKANPLNLFLTHLQLILVWWFQAAACWLYHSYSDKIKVYLGKRNSGISICCCSLWNDCSLSYPRMPSSNLSPNYRLLLCNWVFCLSLDAHYGEGNHSGVILQRA